MNLYLDERSLAARSCGDVATQSDALEVATRRTGSDPNVGTDRSTHVDCPVNIMELIPAADYRPPIYRMLV